LLMIDPHSKTSHERSLVFDRQPSTSSSQVKITTRPTEGSFSLAWCDGYAQQQTPFYFLPFSCFFTTQNHCSQQTKETIPT
jgi:hypothetical protein